MPEISAEPDTAPPFGARTPSRLAADIVYAGNAGGHAYLLRVRHRFLDTSFDVEIDGVLHDPVAEEKRAKKKQVPGSPPSEEPSDGLRFRIGDGFTETLCTVIRPSDESDVAEPEDAELLSVRTTGLGGAGEVEVRHGLERTPLVPERGSPSAERDERRSAHPTRYALIAALTRAAGFLVPLLGLSALLSGLLDPLERRAAAMLRPVADRASQVTEPMGAWFARVLRPVRELLSGILDPVARFWGGLTELLFGWIPDPLLPFAVPEWLPDAVVPVVVVTAVFLATSRRLRQRREKLEAAREAADSEDSEASAGRRS